MNHEEEKIRELYFKVASKLRDDINTFDYMMKSGTMKINLVSFSGRLQGIIRTFVDIQYALFALFALLPTCKRAPYPLDVLILLRS